MPRTTGEALVIRRHAADEDLVSGARSNQIAVSFLKIDVATAQMLLRMAQDNPVSKRRFQLKARKAYKTVVRLIERVSIGEEDARILSINLQGLKSRLIELGEPL